MDDKLEEELASLRQQLSEESQARKDAELEVEAARKAQERLQVMVLVMESLELRIS